MITLLVIAASSLWGMYLAYKLGRWHGEQATVALLRKDIKSEARKEKHHARLSS
jgi:membrane protein DedA with SNARE-associated domain